MLAATHSNGTARSSKVCAGNRSHSSRRSVPLPCKGRTFVTMEFDAAPGQAITSQLATQVAQGRDAIVKDKAPI
jgi:hypothetical protein